MYVYLCVSTLCLKLNIDANICTYNAFALIVYSYFYYDEQKLRVFQILITCTRIKSSQIFTRYVIL